MVVIGERDFLEDDGMVLEGQRLDDLVCVLHMGHKLFDELLVAVQNTHTSDCFRDVVGKVIHVLKHTIDGQDNLDDFLIGDLVCGVKVIDYDQDDNEYHQVDGEGVILLGIDTRYRDVFLLTNIGSQFVDHLQLLGIPIGRGLDNVDITKDILEVLVHFVLDLNLLIGGIEAFTASKVDYHDLT